LPKTFCFIVEFRDPETDEVFAEIGQADTEATCRELIRHEITCWRSRGYEFHNAEFSAVSEFRAGIPIPAPVEAWQRELSAA